MSRVLNNLKALSALGFYEIWDWLKDWLQSSEGKDNLYRLRMDLLRIAFRRYRGKMIKTGFVLILFKVYHHFIYKPFVGRVVLEHFYQMNPNPTNGGYVVRLGSGGLEYELGVAWNLIGHGPMASVNWGSNWFIPESILVWSPHNKG